MRIQGKISGVIITTLIMLLSCGSNKAKETDNSINSSVGEEHEILNDFISSENEQINSLSADAKPIKFKGSYSGAPNTLIYLSRLTTKKLVFTDSVRTDTKGNFEFNTNLDKEDLFFVTLNKMSPPGVPVVLGPGAKLNLEMDQSDFIKTSVKGNALNKDLKALYDVYTKHNSVSAEFNNRVSKINPNTASATERNAIQSEYAKIQSDMLKDIEGFVASHKGSIVSYFAATYILPKPPISLTELALNKMKKDVPSSPYTSELEARLSSIKPLDIGGLAPEIALKSPEGQEIKLSSLKGKVVLIDFWASWCGPCRRENPNVVKAYAKYKDKGFEIYGVSLDKDLRKWKGAIAQDGITWVQVSDLKGWSNVAAKAYKVHSIPSTVLLDANGRIIAKDLRGAALEAKLAEILGGH